jgi:glycosyltransferase 2 family protein
MRKSFVTVAQYVIFLGLGIFLLWLTTRNLSDEELTLMKGFQPKTANTFFAVMLSYFFNLLVPRLGEVMKCTILARYEKTPVDKLVGTMVAERAFDFICLVLVVIITIFIQIDVVGGFASVEFGKIMAKASQDPKRVIIPVIAIIVGFFIVRFLLSRYAHISIVGRIKKIVRGVWEGLTSVRHVKRKTAFFLHTIFIWSMYLLSIQIGFYTMESVAHLGIKPSFTILSFGSLAMIVTQGGIGAYQLAVEKTLTLYGIAEVNGLAYGWLLWLVQTLMVLGVGFLCLMILPIYNRKRHERSITG